MAYLHRSDPVAAMEAFLAKIAPHDPHPEVRALSVELRSDGPSAVFALSERAAGALAELLVGYVDPDDCGSCADCGKPLDKNLCCVACGRVDGIFGLTIASRAADVRRREGGRHGAPTTEG
ncbi:hypothetical protein SAMN05444365_106179 [Micromonospora pattaloongensis]|uniref:Uncharacterized protein n=1 Tax=Micromonospora pattaloongensis TaxID=405436 RepID=A0A1H3QXG4_9ACTN|nr:hypothetical protein [Micromonospora pattaloongensis]SDZ17943.1 hypothetical protein SAMN05444365_106179 [Micromonospora pattaloongensis]